MGHCQLIVKIFLRVGRSSTNDDSFQSLLLHNLVYWVNTRVQDEGDTCALVDLLQGFRTAVAVDDMEPGRACMKEVQRRSKLGPVAWDARSL